MVCKKITRAVDLLETLVWEEYILCYTTVCFCVQRIVFYFGAEGNIAFSVVPPFHTSNTAV